MSKYTEKHDTGLHSYNTESLHMCPRGRQAVCLAEIKTCINTSPVQLTPMTGARLLTQFTSSYNCSKPKFQNRIETNEIKPADGYTRPDRVIDELSHSP